MPEQQNIEWKTSWRDEYLKWICGFANAKGGNLFIGMDDNAKVVGSVDYKRLLDDIPNKIQNHLGCELLSFCIFDVLSTVLTGFSKPNP